MRPLLTAVSVILVSGPTHAQTDTDGRALWLGTETAKRKWERGELGDHRTSDGRPMEVFQGECWGPRRRSWPPYEIYGASEKGDFNCKPAIEFERRKAAGQDPCMTYVRVNNNLVLVPRDGCTP